MPGVQAALWTLHSEFSPHRVPRWYHWGSLVPAQAVAHQPPLEDGWVSVEGPVPEAQQWGLLPGTQDLSPHHSRSCLVTCVVTIRSAILLPWGGWILTNPP